MKSLSGQLLQAAARVRASYVSRVSVAWLVSLIYGFRLLLRRHRAQDNGGSDGQSLMLLCAILRLQPKFARIFARGSSIEKGMNGAESHFTVSGPFNVHQARTAVV